MKYFRNKRFPKQNQSLCKKCGYFLKMADIYNNKLMGLLIIVGEDCYWAKNIWKKGVHKDNGCIFGKEREMVNVHYAYNHSVKKYWQQFLYFNSIQIKVKIMFFHFFHTVQVDFHTIQVDTIYQKVIYTCLFLF